MFVLLNHIVKNYINNKILPILESNNIVIIGIRSNIIYYIRPKNKDII